MFQKQWSITSHSNRRRIAAQFYSNVRQKEMVESLHIEIQEEEQYLIANVSGALSLGNLKELVDIVETETKKRGYDLFLVDMLRTGPPEKEMDRFYIGEYVASKLRGLKVAAVYPEELINKFAENTAVNRGASLTVVGDREQAIKWLLESQPNKADTSDA